MNSVAAYHLPFIVLGHPFSGVIPSYKQWARWKLMAYRKAHPRLHKALVDWAGGLSELVEIVTHLRACRCLRQRKSPVLLNSWRALRTAHPTLSKIV